MRRLLITSFSIATFSLLLVAGPGQAQERLNYDQIANNVLAATANPAEPNRVGEKELKAAEPGKKLSKHGVTNFDAYRDCNPYPIDPRKPCPICTGRKGTFPKFKDRHDRIYGFQGRPYREQEPGTCLCGKKKQKFKFTNINVYWPSSLAGVWEDRFPVLSDLDARTYSRFHLTDVFDKFGGFELSSYERKDNGYCGPGFDRYGCLGESKTLEAGHLLCSSCNQCQSCKSVCNSCKKSCVCSGRNKCPNWNPN